MRIFLVIAVIAISVLGCQFGKGKEGSQNSSLNNCFETIEKQNFIDTINGKSTSLYFLSNGPDFCAAITNYGGRIVGLKVPDKDGELVDVVLGFNSLEGYVKSSEPYFGALIGRVGNRIANGRFELNGKTYNLPKNNGPNTLHGGIKGFQDVVWDAEQTSDSSLVLSYFSPDGEEGFPGNLEVTVVYTLTSDKGLKIEYKAATDAPTPVNLTNHAFFNLNGEGSGTVNDHILWINANIFTPVDSTLIPIGELRPVKGTPFDFTTSQRIGNRLDTTANLQLKYGKGYDHNFVLNPNDKKTPKVARIEGDKSGIVMEVYTSEPGMQFYGGNFMQSLNTLKSGSKDDFRTAFCLETQHFPDTPNQTDFPSILLNEGEVYQTVSIYKFSAEMK